MVGVTEDDTRDQVRWEQMIGCGDPLKKQENVEEEHQ